MELFSVSDEDIKEIYRFYATNPKRVSEDVLILEEWTKQQLWLPKHQCNKDILKRALSASKYSVEKAKKRLEQFFVLKNLNKDFFITYGTDEFIPVAENVVRLTPLPKLGPKQERIFLFRLANPDVEKYTYEHSVQAILSGVELALRYDQTSKIRIICDSKGHTFDYIKKVEWNRCTRLLNLIMNGYGAKLEAVHIINAHPSAHIIVNIIKTIIKEKLLQRVLFHDSLKSLYEYVPQMYLPLEYGGTSGKLSDIYEILASTIEENRYKIAESVDYEIDQKLKAGVLKTNVNDEVFGVDGTFRKLTLD